MSKTHPRRGRGQLIYVFGLVVEPRRTRIRKEWQVEGLHGRHRVLHAWPIAEDEGHHPDLHLEGYRNVWIELWTHAFGGLSENDFILAAKIDRLPLQLPRPAR